jgi:hypothetical protein
VKVACKKDESTRSLPSQGLNTELFSKIFSCLNEYLQANHMAAQGFKVKKIKQVGQFWS